LAEHVNQLPDHDAWDTTPVLAQIVKNAARNVNPVARAVGQDGASETKSGGFEAMPLYEVSHAVSPSAHGDRTPGVTSHRLPQTCPLMTPTWRNA
jgi:hypothetical protein